MPRLLAIDVGTSFIKAALVEPETRTLRDPARVSFPSFLDGLPPLHREVDPIAILSAVDALLAPHAKAIDGLVLCGQMHGFILVDSRNQPLSNYISWLDQRVAAPEFEEMASLFGEADREAVGREMRPSIAVSLLYWLRQHSQLPAAATPVSIADFVAARLCGAPPVMEPTNAAAFGALRLDTLCWHDDLITRLRLDTLRWPEVQPAGTEVGRWRGVPCYVAIGDQQASLAGALLDPEDLSINIGTGSQVTRITSSPVTDGFQTRPYFDGRFLRTITHIPAGRALSSLVRLFTELGDVSEEEAWTRILPALAATPTTDIRAGLAFFPGPCGHGGFLENLTEANMTTGHIFRAAFESMSHNYADCAHRLDPNRTAAKLVFSGGVARRNPLLRDLTAAALDLPHRLSPHEEDTLYGLMVLAGKSS